MTDPITPTYTLLIDAQGNDVSGSILNLGTIAAALQQQTLMLAVLLAITLGLYTAFKLLP